MTACSERKDQLLEVALGVPAASELERHLEVCSACATALSRLCARREQIDTGLHQLVRAGELPSDFRARVLAAVEVDEVTRGLLPAWVAALAAAAVVVLVAMLVGSPGPQMDPAVQAAKELSRWQSPTQSLLRSPAEELLQAAPRLGESYFSLEPISPEMGDKNGGNDES